MPLAGFHPTIQRWFSERFGEPTEPQAQGWPAIRERSHTLISAPTGMGKTLAGYLAAIDSLARQGPDLPDQTQVLYVSPLRALSNDVQKNLQGPLGDLASMDPFFPEIRVQVRTGDTPQRDRAAMIRRHPHILVTTPESLYILLTSNGGRQMLKNVKTTIVDEIHALARDKRGSHMSLSLERLEVLAGPFQRIGLSATQKPLSEVGKFLVGVGRECTLVDVGHRREMDVAIEVPPSPLATVCSHEQWDEIYTRIAKLIDEHRTTLIFVNTRKMAERITARLTDVMGEEKVTCHHSSLSKERRLDAESRLKAGSLKALVATASLELGIDIGDVDLVIQVGATRAIATFLQRVGRSGHAIRRLPKGRLFPLTVDELVEAAALLRAMGKGQLDRTPQPRAPLDILAQHIVAACVEAGEAGWKEEDLFDTFRRAWPYRAVTREEFDSCIALHTNGRHGLLHRDAVGGRIMARKRARIPAITSGGAIPDVADYRVLQEPEGLFVGTLNEDFAVESNVGDIFQLGNTSWRVMKVERGVMRVADAQGQPPTIPFWLGEGPSRTAELSAEIADIRESCEDATVLEEEIGLCPEASEQIAEYIADGRRVLGTVPTQRRLVLERFFDESGGMQMVLHAPFGGRINRAWGLALRKRFCRGFGFELQAAANEEAIVISLGSHHSFPLEDVFNYLNPKSVKDILTQAVLDQPMFESRWRWNATRSLVLSRFQNGKPVPPQILRMRAADLLAQSFPAAVACPENLPPGDLPIPMEHPLIRQTIDDCLTESTDVEGLIAVLEELRDGRIERVAVDTPEPSAFARGILNSELYTFLDDAPLEERRTQAVISRRGLDPKALDNIGALEPAAVERVRQEAFPQPETMEEVHDALLWMGFVTDAEVEAGGWLRWLNELAVQMRVLHEDGRWFAVDRAPEPRKILLGRLEALGPVAEDDPRIAIGDQAAMLLMELEHEGVILRTRWAGHAAWCERRLLARIHRYTIERLRQEIEPVTASQFMQFLACWQHADPGYQLEGPIGVAEVLKQLAGFEIPAWAWESHVLPSRVKDYRREWLDELTLHGEFVWGRLWGGAATPMRITPISMFPREDLETWLTMADEPASAAMSGSAADLLNVLQLRGPQFPQILQRAANLVQTHTEMGLAELVARGHITCDSFAALRQMITPPSKRRFPLRPVGRWSCFRSAVAGVADAGPGSANPATGIAASVSATPPRSGRISPFTPDSPAAELAAKQLLRRTGVVFRRTFAREKLPITWLTLSRIYRRLELRGEVRGGRFVAGFSGEQFALPEAVEQLRSLRRKGNRPETIVLPTDPLFLQGILTPDIPIAKTKERAG
jgi:ATP-dependent Lhr-like helicase